MNKIVNILTCFLLSALFFSCTEDLQKEDYDYVQDPSKIGTSVTLNSLVQISDNSVQVRATITPSTTDVVLDRGFVYATKTDFAQFTVLSVTPDTASTGITMNRNQTIEQGIQYYFKAFVATKDGMLLSSNMESITLPVIPWVSLGMATYTCDFVSTFFGITRVPYQVEIQENQLNPGLFRLVNPYGAAYPFNDPGDWDNSKDYYLVIDATDPEGVYIPHPQYSGMNWGYGEFIMSSLAGLRIYRGTSTLEEQKALGTCGTYVNGVITFPKNALTVGMVDYNNAAMYGANTNEWFQVIMPGVSIVEYDYSAEITYSGRFTDKAGNDFAIAEVSLGEDVAYAKVTMVSGGMTQEALSGILDGSIESIEIKTDGAIQAACTESNTYTYIVVTFDAEDEPQEFDYDTFDFYTSSGGGGGLPTIDDFYGNYLLTGPSQFEGEAAAAMPVSIEMVNTPNTLLITGVDFTAYLTATFDPATGYMHIAPQPVINFTYQGVSYPVNFLTTTKDGDVSDKIALKFNRRMNGSLALAPESMAEGYLLGFELGYIDGYYNIEFTPVTTRSASIAKTIVTPFSEITNKELKKAAIESKKASDKSGFTIHPKNLLKLSSPQKAEMISD